jgi:hypothetical protein
MPNGNGNNARLDSWKDIASYLSRDVRTVIRWEQQRGLPVRRLPGAGRKVVFAYTAELDAWLTQDKSAPQGLQPVSNGGLTATGQADGKDPDSGRPRWPYSAASVAAVALLAIAIIAFRWRTHAAGPALPVRVGFTLNALQAFDASGQMIWSYSLPGTIDPNEFIVEDRRLQDNVRIADFRGDGEREVLAVLAMRVSPNAKAPDRLEVDMFSSAGRLIWSYVPRGHLVFATHDLRENWLPLDVFVSGKGKKQIWVAVDHGVWGHSFIVSLDPETGKDTLRYVNSGSTVSLNELVTPQGRSFLLAGGFNNEYDSGSLAVIDESKGFAVSPQTEGTSHKCLNCPKGDPDYYFVFPRSEINELMQFYEDRVYKISVTNDEIELRKEETQLTSPAQSLYVLRSDSVVHPVSVQFETDYDLLHNKLEREGKLSHNITRCPERQHPRPVRVWTPANGWKEIALEPGAQANAAGDALSNQVKIKN